jgi:DNA-binding NtrC family response regulator
MNTDVRLLIVDNDLSYAAEIAKRLSECPRQDLGGASLQIELSNSAYYVVDQLSRDPVRWHVVFSDVYMPIPSQPRTRNQAEVTAKETWTTIAGRRCRTWQYDYTWNSHDEGTPAHGGFHIAKVILAARNAAEQESAKFSGPKLVLISGRLMEEHRPLRDELFQNWEAVKGWLIYHDKARFDRGIADWPSQQLRPDIFEWALVHAISLRERTEWVSPPKNFVSNSPKMQTLLVNARNLARQSHPVLITGAPGTGKTTLANFMHTMRHGDGAEQKPCRVVDVNLLNNPLGESHLFGHVKGAFTDATKDRAGWLATSGDGTLILDEIGDASPDIQGKLLRLLRERKYTPVGSDETRDCHVGVIVCCTNKNLNELVQQKPPLFREDLLDRIAGREGEFELRVPPLNERREDIVPLAESTLCELQTDGGTRPRLSADAKTWLQQQPWPGNVEHLRTRVQRAAASCLEDQITAERLRQCAPEANASGLVTASQAAQRTTEEVSADGPTDEQVVVALERHRGNREQTASELHLSDVTLRARLKKIESQRPDLAERIHKWPGKPGRPRKAS